MHKQSEFLLLEKCKKLEKELVLKNRELEIEEAMERIRSRSMAMHKSDELMEVIQLVYEQLVRLNIKINSTNFCLNYKESDDFTFWTAIPGRPYPTKFFIPYFDHPWFIRFKEAKKKRLPFTADRYSFEEKNRFWIHFFDHAPTVTDERKKFILSGPGLAVSQVYMNTISLIITNYEGIPFSDEENAVFKRIGEVFEQTYTRFLDLQKAEEQAREAQIEAALERVRSRTMGMQKSEELTEVIAHINAEITNLGIRSDSTAIITEINLTENLGSICMWFSIPGKTYSNKFYLPFTQHPMFYRLLEARKKKKEFYTEFYSKEERIRYLKIAFEESDLKLLPDERKEYLLNAPAWTRTVTLQKNSGLILQRYSNEAFSDKDNAVAIRFGRVFEQTYTRFLDLQKAEAQTREAHIEAALERVRAKAMAMHSTADISDATAVVFNELTRLGIDMERCGIALINESPIFEVWSTPLSPKNKEVVNVVTGHVDSRTHPMNQQVHQNWKEKKDYSFYKLVGDEVRKYYDKLEKQPGYQFPKISRYPDHQISYCFFFNQGGIFVFANDELKAEEKIIFKRFTKVFEQTYTRFLDLQKAEAQAREAQIEAALERVRAKAMAMHSSKDISVATVIIFNELKRLGINMIRAGIVIFNKTHIGEVWSTRLSPDDNQVIDIVTGNLDFDIHPMLQNWYRAWKDKQDYYTYKLVGDDIRNYYELLGKQPGYKFPKTNKYPNRQIANSFFLNEVNIFAYTSEPLSAEEKQIVHRFTKVFSLTYRRYKDLIIAEAQAREAIKQASLDRVRGEIASMRTSDDLNRITPVIWRELQALEVPFIRCGVFIVDEKNKIVHVYLTTPDGKPLGVLNLLFDANEVTANTVDFWRKKEVYKEYWNKEDFINWTKSMMKLGQVSNPETYQGAAHPPESLHLHFLPFKQGMLYVGNTSPLEKEVLELVKSLAESFSIAYARYEDFRQLEEAKNQIEKTFTELKAAQSQLIQSEKMASLGELTAGIAHEIQNPLNFVNNFSEVSKELIDEMNEELEVISRQYAAGSWQTGEEKLNLTKEIANDIKQNLEKINHHGKRAADIVKGMLQHSRTSSGQKEPTDINALADEYLRLAYHGLRAKDKTFNADFKTDFDESLPKINVIPQDIGRVLLNLINNAFYAVDKKAKDLTPQPPDGGAKNSQTDFRPLVIITTTPLKSPSGDLGVEICVKDNGPGIPAHIVDKIFQPFFTTKPTGQGTGLGLSLSYDIIKAHGGELKVETKEGEGSEFIVRLSLVENIK